MTGARRAHSADDSRSSRIRSNLAFSPMHRHEDEYTCVLEGEIGVQVGDEVHIACPGDLDFKPRGVPHAFWNAGDFERYFVDIAPLLPPAHDGAPDAQALGAVMAR
jgi:quercetin dioxygenase-like cupin family protein